MHLSGKFNTLKPIDCELVWLSCEVFLQRAIEDLICGGSTREQGHGRSELQVIRRVKNLVDRTPVHLHHKFSAMP